MILELIFGIKVETINLLRNADLTEKKAKHYKRYKTIIIYKTGPKIITSGYLEIKNTNFTTIITFTSFLEDRDINNILVPNKISYSEKNYMMIIILRHHI